MYIYIYDSKVRVFFHAYLRSYTYIQIIIHSGVIYNKVLVSTKVHLL